MPPVSRSPAPIVLRDLKPAPEGDPGTHRRFPKKERLILHELGAPPVGPFEMSDAEGRRLVPRFPTHLSESVRALRQAGVIEMVIIPCQCGRRATTPTSCSCPLAAFRLAAAPARSNVIHAAARFLGAAVACLVCVLALLVAGCGSPYPPCSFEPTEEGKDYTPPPPQPETGPGPNDPGPGYPGPSGDSPDYGYDRTAQGAICACSDKDTESRACNVDPDAPPSSSVLVKTKDGVCDFTHYESDGDCLPLEPDSGGGVAAKKKRQYTCHGHYKVFSSPDTRFFTLYIQATSNNSAEAEITLRFSHNADMRPGTFWITCSKTEPK